MAIGFDPTPSFAALFAMLGFSLILFGWAISPALSIVRYVRKPLVASLANASGAVWALVAGGFGLVALGLHMADPSSDWLALPLALGAIPVGTVSALEIHLRQRRWRREDLEREVKVTPDVPKPHLS